MRKHEAVDCDGVGGVGAEREQHEAGVVAVAPAQGRHRHLACAVRVRSLAPPVCVPVQHQPATAISTSAISLHDELFYVGGGE